MLTNQAPLKKSICEKMFHITYIKIGVPPRQLFSAVSNSLILVNCKKYIFRILQILLTAGFIIYYYEIYSDSFIHLFIHSVKQVQINIYQSNTYRKDLSWLYFDDEPRVPERQQVKDQQSCISVSVAYPAIPSSN